MKMGAGILALVMGISAFAQFDIPTSFPEAAQPGGLTQKPEFFTMGWEKGAVLSSRPVPISIEVDSLGNQNVHLLIDSEGRPVLYTSNIATPVCADGECRPMHIKLYWTLLGGYAGFDRYPDLPFTKHDHDEFLWSDYLKLHQLLLDDNSILKRKKIDELVKKPKVVDNENVDAVAGATISEVKESVVEGALYSCYTAWHLVHGAVKDNVKEHTLSLIDYKLVLQMLASEDADYQLFALKWLDEKQYSENHQRIAEIFRSGIPLVRTFIIKNLPTPFWESEKLQAPFWQSFKDVDINSRSLLLEHLEDAPESIILHLSETMGAMTKNQLRAYLEFLGASEEIHPKVRGNLKTFSTNPNQTYAYLMEQFLEDFE